MLCWWDARLASPTLQMGTKCFSHFRRGTRNDIDWQIAAAGVTTRAAHHRSMKASQDRKPLDAPVRRTQAQRRAATRQKVIQAARKLLYDKGFTGATTLAIRDLAGISTGAMQGQFPTKASIMAAIVVEMHQARKAELLAMIEIQPPRVRIERLIDESMEYRYSENSIIGTEILLAKRNDPELTVLLDPVHEESARWMTGFSEKIFAGVPLSKKRQEFVININALFLRGANLEFISNKKSSDQADLMAQWKKLILDLIF